MIIDSSTIFFCRQAISNTYFTSRRKHKNHKNVVACGEWFFGDGCIKIYFALKHNKSKVAADFAIFVLHLFLRPCTLLDLLSF